LFRFESAFVCKFKTVLVYNTRNSLADEIANVSFLRRHRTRTTQ